VDVWQGEERGVVPLIRFCREEGSWDICSELVEAEDKQEIIKKSRSRRKYFWITAIPYRISPVLHSAESGLDPISDYTGVVDS
jgi:hypothetical protein